MSMGQATERVGIVPVTIRSRSIKFTPERLQQVINLVERGKSRDEIADIFGVTVASLQLTCSKMGISLRRPKFINGVCLLKKRKSFCENASLTHHPSNHDGRVPLQPTKERSQGNSQSESVAPALITESQQERPNSFEASSAGVAIRFQYGRMERTDELPLTVDMIGQLALEAELWEMRIGEFIAELIRKIVTKNLFSRVLGDIDPRS
jgi:hypothetical protein